MTTSSDVITGWVPIIGRWTFSDGLAVYDGPDEGRAPYGICVCALEFDEGDVELTVELGDLLPGKSQDSSGRILLGYRTLSEPYICLGIGGYYSGYVISGFEPPTTWRALSITGSDKVLKPNRRYNLSASLLSQQIILQVNGAKVLEHRLSKSLGVGQIGLFAWGERQVKFQEVVARPRLPQAFVVMEFSAPYTEVYAKVIQAAAAKVGIEAFNVGEILRRGVILDDIARSIKDSALVVAEITPPNQNVYYELGFAHAIGKPAILMAQKGTKLPFDIRFYRVLFYENSDEGLEEARDKLEQYLSATLQELRAGRGR